jgi:peroxiredoxin
MTMPRLNAWHEKYADQGLHIIGLSSEDDGDIKKAIDERHLSYPIARDEDGVAARAFGVTALPTLVVVDRAGIVRYVTLGAGDLDAVESVIQSLLR